MISPDYCRMMARYNRWQNESLYEAADGLGKEARQLDRGAFFGSIRRTLSHLLWGDMIWMSRFDGGERPPVGIAESADYMQKWSELRKCRIDLDARILGWAEGLTEAELGGPLRWFSGALGEELERPFALCVVHFFNHQTHHRGQVHAMLTAAGARPDDTDLFMLDAR